MAYAAWSVAFGEQPSASKWNILGTNDAAFNNGTGITALSHAVTAVANPYKFLAYQTGTAHTLANTSPTKVVLNTEAYDTNNNFDSTTNYRYTVPVSGFYQICVQFTPTAGANTAVDCYLYKNGSLYANSKMGNTGSVANASASINLLMQLTAADYLELYGACGSGSGTTLAGGGTVWNYMSGYLVSRT